MSNQYLKLRRSSVPGKVPASGSIDFGELALNTYDGLVFMKKSGSSGEEVISIGSGGGGTINTGSFATTGSNRFNGDQTITGSLTVTNTITAQKLIVQTITSSVLYSSGSNIFGNNLANTQVFTGSVYITGSNFLFNNNRVIDSSLTSSMSVLSASYAATASIASVANTVLTSSVSYISSSNSISLNEIEVADYDNNTAVTFVNGRLKFIFGTPTVPSAPVASFNSTFATDRFNAVTDAYTVTGTIAVGGYTLISASLYEGATLLTSTGSNATSLVYNTTTTGSHTYSFQVTASSPLDGTINTQTVSLAGTLSKVAPGSPTITPTATVQLGSTSNQIEVGATGSIVFTSGSGTANSWVHNFTSTNVASPIFVTGSATGSASITATATSNYSSSGVLGSDNNPPLTTTSTNSFTYTKIRSLRYGASPSSSFTANELENISLWDTTLGGSIGTISKGTTTASGQTLTITWTGDKFHYIAYNSSLANLTNITTGGFGVFSSFTLITIGSYKVYKSNTLQAGGSGTSITYVLT